jgi:hypothetical protein
MIGSTILFGRGILEDWSGSWLILEMRITLPIVRTIICS